MAAQDSGLPSRPRVVASRSRIRSSWPRRTRPSLNVFPPSAGLRLLRECAAPAARAAHGRGVRAGAGGGRRDGAHVLPEGHPGGWASLECYIGDYFVSLIIGAILLHYIIKFSHPNCG